jgi:hypothetical protein
MIKMMSTVFLLAVSVVGLATGAAMDAEVVRSARNLYVRVS